MSKALCSLLFRCESHEHSVRSVQLPSSFSKGRTETWHLVTLFQVIPTLADFKAKFLGRSHYCFLWLWSPALQASSAGSLPSRTPISISGKSGLHASIQLRVPKLPQLLREMKVPSPVSLHASIGEALFHLLYPGLSLNDAWGEK